MVLLELSFESLELKIVRESMAKNLPPLCVDCFLSIDGFSLSLNEAPIKDIVVGLR